MIPKIFKYNCQLSGYYVSSNSLPNIYVHIYTTIKRSHSPQCHEINCLKTFNL